MNSASPRSVTAQVAAPCPPTQISAYLADLYTALDHMEKSIEVHGTKIEPVLAATNPSKAEADFAPQEMLCPVATRIREASQRLNGLARRLGELTERVEA